MHDPIHGSEHAQHSTARNHTCQSREVSSSHLSSLAPFFLSRSASQITLAPLLLRLLDTPEFQRLRDLKQLGCAYLVFPGASHNRFEHSMGVAHLAELMLSHLRDTQPELGITPRDIELVKVAGLCHDLGHGPFSHCFEEFMHMARPDSEYRHERMSLQMLEVIINKVRATQTAVRSREPLSRFSVAHANCFLSSPACSAELSTLQRGGSAVPS